MQTFTRSSEPRRRTLRQFNVILDSEGYHRFPEFAVVAAVEFQIHHVATSTTPVSMISAGWVDVKRGRLVLMVRQGAVADEPCIAAKRLQVRVPSCNLLDGHVIADSFAALAETVDVIWCPV
jgi:hypothetical protein